MLSAMTLVATEIVASDLLLIPRFTFVLHRQMECDDAFFGTGEVTYCEGDDACCN